MSVVLFCVSCDKEPIYESEPVHPERAWEDGDNNGGDNGNNSDNGDNNGDNNGGDNGDNGDNNGGDNSGSAKEQNQNRTITRLYSAVMRREIPYPFKAYFMEIDGKEYYYMLRYYFNHELKVGDKISFTVSPFCPNEISSINGYSLGDGSDASGGGSSGYLVASDPIEATIFGYFPMKICYSLSLVPFDSWCIVTTDGNLIYMKKSKFKDFDLGDRIVYNVYTLFPNEVVAIKKL